MHRNGIQLHSCNYNFQVLILLYYVYVCLLILYMQTVSKLLELHVKLHKLGHPNYLMKWTVPPIKCSEDAVTDVDETKHQLNEWKQELSECQARCIWLPFFSMPKVLLVYRFIRSSSLDDLVHEISFLVSNETTRDCLEEKIQVCTMH